MAKEHIDTIIFPQGGLNTDDDLLMLPSGDARFRENVILSDDGNFNVLTNVLGNTLKNTSSGGSFTYPGGTLRVIGYVENKEEKAGIFFIYSSTGEHSIVQYYSETDTLEYILRGGSPTPPPYSVGNILNFDINHFIDAGIVGNEEDKFLIWTDGYNVPRMINIQMALNYTSGSGTPIYSGITEELISFYKKPYTGYIRFAGDNYDASFNGNNIQNKVFQFSIRLKYYDKTYSPLAPYSDFRTTTYELPSGRTSDALANNRISIDLNFDNDVDLVDSYQLLFRNIDIGSGTPGNWYIYDTYPYTATGTVTRYFYNEKNSGVISSEEILRYYDYVPDLAPHLGIIDSNRIVFGGVKEGYENVDYNNLSDWNVSLACTEVAISSIDEGIQYELNGIIDNFGTNPTSIVFNHSETSANDYYWSLSIIESPGFASYDYVVESSFGKDHTSIYSTLATWINGLSVDLNAVAGATLTVSITGGSANVYGLYLIILEKTPIINTAKTGAVYKFGIVYHYDGKLGYVQSNDDLREETPNFGDITSTYLNYYLRFDLTINHIAPAGATAYQIVSFGNNIDYYEQYLVRYNIGNKSDSSSNYTIYTDGSNTIIKRTELINRFTAAYNDGINYGFDYQVGDKIRFIGEFHEITGSGITEYDVDIFSSPTEYNISAVSSTEIKCSFSALNNISTTTGIIFIEILRLKNQSDNTSQEFSELYPIDSSGYHGGNFQSQTGVQPAIVRITNDFTDCWKSKQVFINNLNISDYGIGSLAGGYYAWMEKPFISLYYDSKPTSWGRDNAINENSESRAYNKIRWGGILFDNAGVNFISKFDYDDERILDDRNGIINKIQQIGDTLKVYQERMTNSFYLKTTSSTSADGSQTYVFNDSVMSQVRQSVFEYGCTHFSSYIKTVREAFYFDVINAVVIKDTPGGPVVISDQKMHTYFKAKSKEVLEYAGTVLVLGGFDEDLDMYYITFYDPDTPLASINETVGYYLPLERWVSFYSFLPEYYGKISGDTALTFCDGQLYVQNSNATRNNFCGSQFTSIVDVHSTANAPLIKEFESIEIISTGQWSPNQDTDIEINLPDFMQSRLLEGKFKRQEGIYSSEFLKDALVDNGLGTKSFVRQQLHSGRTLRGHEIRVRLRNDDTTEANLRLVVIKGNISR